MSTIFPIGLALGEAFYDRVQERQTLQNHIQHGIHTVLIAPRRFGKTSLIKKVLDDTETPHIWLDFMTLTSKTEAQARFLVHIGDLIVTIAKTEKQVKQWAKKYFALFKPEISIGIPGFLKITLKPEHIPHEGLATALLKLDQLAQDAGIRLAIICDEFQEIMQIDQDATLQASIRHAAERAQAITYLFSGSKHQPLRRLFNGKQNPLYQLCEQMTLERIAQADYVSYLTVEAKKKWKHPLSDTVLARIFFHTDYYPKYVNALCAKLWFHTQAPTPEVVDACWQSYIFARKADIAEELNNLTLNQRKLFRYMTTHPTDTPFGHAFSSDVGLSVSTIQTALPVLLEKDLVVALEGSYRVLDPTFKYYFQIF